MHHWGVWKAVAAVGALGSTSMFAQVDFSHTITLGSVILGVIVTALAGLVTIRARVGDVWRQTAEGRAERIKELELAAKDAERDHIEKLATFEREQQELRHGLKDDLAACRAELTLEKAKHDLGSVIEQMNTLHHEAMTVMHDAQGEAVASVAGAILELGSKVEAGQSELRVGQRATLDLLKEIRDALQTGD